MPNLGQMSPEEKQAYMEYLRGLATQQKASVDAGGQAQGQMDMARSGDVGLEFGNQAGAIIQNMLGQQGSAQMFAQKANQAPLTGMAQQDAERFAQHLKDQARLGDSMGQAKIHMGARQTDLTQKAEMSEQERQQVLLKMLAEQKSNESKREHEKAVLAETRRHNIAMEHRGAGNGAGTPKLRPLGESHVNQLADFQSARQAIGQVYDQWKALFSGESAAQRIASKAGAMPGASLFGPTDAKKYKDATAALKTVLGKKTLQDALSDKERETFFANLPVEGDSDEVAANKITVMNQLLDNIINNRVTGLKAQHYDVGDTFDAKPGPQDAPSKTGTEFVLMRGPDGVVMNVPKANVAEAKKRGASEVSQ